MSFLFLFLYSQYLHKTLWIVTIKLRTKKSILNMYHVFSFINLLKYLILTWRFLIGDETMKVWIIWNLITDITSFEEQCVLVTFPFLPSFYKILWGKHRRNQKRHLSPCLWKQWMESYKFLYCPRDPIVPKLTNQDRGWRCSWEKGDYVLYNFLQGVRNANLLER